MATMKRKIVEIDEERCNGCGQCVPACEEGALKVVDGTATLVQDSYCDGLGACLGDCPRDAIRITEREAEPFDEEAVEEHMAENARDAVPAGGCPGAALKDFGGSEASAEDEFATGQGSALRQWPVQLHLVPPDAPYLDGAELLVSADCVAFATADFHGELLDGRRLVVGCPKLDERDAYRTKLAAILKRNDIRSLTVAHMEVPCCHGLVELTRRAMEDAESEVALDVVQVGIDGRMN